MDEGGPSEVFDFVKTLTSGEKVVTQVRLMFLRAEEDMEALRAAQQTAREMKEGADYGDIYKEAQAHEILVRALRATEQHERPDKTKYYPPLCVGTAHLRKAFNASEMSVLLNCYQLVKSKYGPLETLEKESAETWIARLSDPIRGPFFLSELDSLHWPGLIVLLAGICRDLYREVGLELPSLPSMSESAPENSTSDTGSSTELLSASSTADPGLKVGPGQLLTKQQAEDLLKKRKQ